jgi:hypothetical protein
MSDPILYTPATEQPPPGTLIALSPPLRSFLPEVMTFGIFLLAGLCLTLWTFNPVRLERERLATQIEFFTALQEQGFKMEVK